MLNVAIIGTGGISVHHIKGYLQLKDECKIVALCDIYPEKAEKIKQDFNLDADVYEDHLDVIQRGDIDLVSVCTPPYTHAEISINMMKGDVDVLVEKPMAVSLEECDQMIDVRNNTGKRLSVISQNRFTDPILKLKKMLDLNVSGKVVHVRVDSFWWRARSYYDLWWRGTWEKEGGGCTLNHAVHHIDILCWMNGLPTEMTAYLANLSHDNSEVEDFSTIIAKHANGSISQMTTSLVHHGEDQKLIFQCEKSRLSAPWDPYVSKPKSNGFYTKDEEGIAKLNNIYNELANLQTIGHTAQVKNFVDAINNNKPCLVTGEDGRNTIEYITSVYKSWFEKKTVILPLEKDDVWYTQEGIMSQVQNFYEKTGSVENFDDEIIV